MKWHGWKEKGLVFTSSSRTQIPLHKSYWKNTEWEVWKDKDEMMIDKYLHLHQSMILKTVSKTGNEK
jgi:hypothetical protein